jgi:hypothetical protein
MNFPPQRNKQTKQNENDTAQNNNAIHLPSTGGIHPTLEFSRQSKRNYGSKNQVHRLPY